MSVMDTQDTQDNTQAAAQPVAQPDAGQNQSTPAAPAAATPVASGPGAAGAPQPAQTGLQMDANVTPQTAAQKVPPAPAPTAAQQKAVTLATKSPNPVAQHIHDVAEVMAGGARYTTTYDADGNPTKHKVPVSTTHLGFALAMEVLRGGLAGASGPRYTAGQRGLEEGKQQAAQRRQAQLDQNNQDSADQARKLDITKTNLTLHLLAQNVGKADEATNRQLDKDYAPVMDDLERNHPEAILDKVPEWGLNDALKKYNVTKDMAIPYDTVPVLETSGPNKGMQAKHADGSPVWGHMYAIVDSKLKTTLSDETQTMGYNVGEFRDADGNKAQIGNPGNWPLKDIIARHTKYAQISTAETLLNNQIQTLKGHENDDPLTLADEVRNKPELRAAIEDYSKYVGVGDLDQVIYTMGQSKDPAERTSAAQIMQLAGVTSQELEDKHNDRVQAAAEAAKPKQATPLTPEKAALIVAQTAAAQAGTEEKGAQARKIDAATRKELENLADAAPYDHSKDRFDDNGLNVGYLETLPVNTRSLMTSMTSGHMAPERLSYLLRGKDGVQLMGMVAHVDPNFDSAKGKSYGDTYKEFTSTRNNVAGGALNSGGTALGHLLELQALNTPGSHVPHRPEWTAYQSKANTLASELAKFYGESTIPAIDALRETLTSTLPGNREAAIRTQAQSMGDKIDSYEQQWKNAAPSKRYEAPMPNITESAKAARAKLDPDGYGKRYEQEHAPANKPGQVFSAKAWATANPNGDVNAAKAAAQKKGFKVVD